MKNEFERETIYYRTPAAETPYARAKQMWDERLASFALGASHWRMIALISAGFSIVLLALLCVSLTWHKPGLYIAHVTADGQVLNVEMLPQQYRPAEAEKEYFITQFVKLIREVPLDPVAAKSNWLTAYHFLSSRGAELLNQFFARHNPVAQLGKKSVRMTLDDINLISENSYHVNWTEESVDQSGQLLGRLPMSGVFTVAIQTPGSKEEMLQNPLGIYIVDFNFSTRSARESG